MVKAIHSFPGPHRRPGYHKLLDGQGFSVWDCVCHCRRDSPASQSVFGAHRVAVLLGGSFHYESDFGATLLAPGSMWLGRAGGGYCYRHVDDGGDRSVIFDFSDEFLGGVRHSSGVRSVDAEAFASASIPASSRTAAATSLTLQALNVDDAEIWEESALLVAATIVLGTARTEAKGERALHCIRRDISWTEARKIAQALRHIEIHHQQDCSLRVLADMAGMSIFRFLRLFKTLTSQTPRQQLVATRLRAAATRLIETTHKVLEIAYDVGFGDISHFNQAFVSAFRSSPTQFRRRYGSYAVRDMDG